MPAAEFGRHCEETPIATRIHLITGACLLSTGLVLGSLNGAIASAEPDDPTASDSSHSTTDSGDSDHASTPSATDDGPSTYDESPGTDGTDTDGDETNTTSGHQRETEPRSPVFAEADATDETPPPDTTSPVPEPVVEVLAPAPSGGDSGATEAKSSSADTPTAEPLSNTQHTADLTAPTVAALASAPPAADPVPVPAPEPAPLQGPPSPAAATPQPAVAPVPAPRLGAAVAYLVSTLVAAALDVVSAVIQLVADLRGTLGIPWAGQDGGDVRLPGPLLAENSIALVLQRILARSLSPKRGSSALGSALAAGMSLGRVLALTSTLQPAALALTDSLDSDSTHPTPAQGVVTALAAMSLWALLSAALPGLSGLLAAAATGVRLGYRQARARMTLHTMELTRYVRAGPIGVVRTGTLVTIHSRTTPAVCTPASGQLRLVS